MDRRGFLQNAMIAAAALVVDPERLPWEPGKKTISIPRLEVTYDTFIVNTAQNITAALSWTGFGTLSHDSRRMKLPLGGRN